jgi:aminoglycoside phosphotransferase (APT) family kinase protein
MACPSEPAAWVVQPNWSSQSSSNCQVPSMQVYRSFSRQVRCPSWYVPAMSRAPWVVEEPVDAERAAALIFRHFGWWDEVTPLGEGWDSAAFRVRDAVFRFPKRAVVVPHLRTELEVLPLLAGLPLPVPQPRWVAEPDELYPFPFMGYPLLPGVPLDESDWSPEHVLDQVLPFLDALHALPLHGPLARVQGWPHTPPSSIEHPVAERARAWLRAHPRPECTPTLIHADLGLEHILVDPDTGRVTGIVDWGDLERGDPAQDLVGLLPWLAGRRPPEELQRAWTMAIHFSLQDCAVLARWLPEQADDAWARLEQKLNRSEPSPDPPWSAPPDP